MVSLRADPGDVETSHDYPGLTRPPGFIISDYDEDNPADFVFPVARPLPLDADHIDSIHVHGHRYVIRYELAPGGRMSTLYQTQQYYEKIAAAAGYKVEKDGGIGDVTESFYKPDAEHPTWVFLEPSTTANVLTIVESSGPAAPPGSAEPLLTLVPPAEAAPPPPKPAALLAPPGVAIPAERVTLPPPIKLVDSPETIAEPGAMASPSADTVTEPAPSPGATASKQITVALNTKTAESTLPTAEPGAATPQADGSGATTTPSQPPPEDPRGDELYASLTASGRVVVPFVFVPGKDALDDSAQPLIDRIAAMMKTHPDLLLRIEGHTDNSGDPDDNLRLSAERAIAIVDKLVAADVDKKRLDPVGVGGLQPLASNITAEGRERNRRIELVTWQKYPAYHSPAAAPAPAPAENDYDPTFHAPAPNGNNYYPNSSSTTSAQ
jgi:outer membrane protein OmpA-like peptidoglycan-associated protein